MMRSSPAVLIPTALLTGCGGVATYSVSEPSDSAQSFGATHEIIVKSPRTGAKTKRSLSEVVSETCGTEVLDVEELIIGATTVQRIVPADSTETITSYFIRCENTEEVLQ